MNQRMERIERAQIQEIYYENIGKLVHTPVNIELTPFLPPKNE